MADTHTYTHTHKQAKKLFFHNSGGQRLKIKVLATCLFPWRVQESFVVSSSFDDFRQPLAYDSITPVSIYVSTKLSPLLLWQGYLTLDQDNYLNSPELPHLETLNYTCKEFFSNKVTLTRVTMCTYFEGHNHPFTNVSHFLFDCLFFETWFIAQADLELAEYLRIS